MASVVQKGREIFPTVVGAYVAVYFLYYVLAVQLTVLTKIQEFIDVALPFYWICFYGGLLLTAIGFCLNELQHKTPGLHWYIAFTILVVVSALVNYENSLFGNLKTAVFMFAFICLFAYYGHWVYTTKSGRKHLKTLLTVVFVIFTVFCFISLLQLLGLQSYIITLETGEIKRQGFTDGRLFGIMNHPNAEAAIAVLAMVFFAYLLLTRETKHKRIAMMIIVINYLYFVATGSRSARICLAMVFLICWIVAGKENLPIEGLDSKWFTRKMIAIAGILSLAMCFILDLAIAGYVIAAKPLLEEWGIIDRSYRLLASRPDTDLSNISNNRFRIWMSYIQILSDGSFVFGFGFRDLVSVVASHYPFSYISYAYYMPHNSFLMVCAVSGIFAMLVWIVLLVRVTVEFFRCSFKHHSETLQMSDLLAFLVLAVILTQAMFGNTIFYYANWDLPFFVISLSYLLQRFDDKKES